MNFKEYCDNLEIKIQATYLGNLTMDQAEKLALEFLAAEMAIAKELTKADMSARMYKSALKATKAEFYLKEVKAVEKKPTEAMLAATIDSAEQIKELQAELDTAEVELAEMERIYDVAKNAQVTYRGIAKGSFNG